MKRQFVILIADDSKTQCKILYDELAAWGYKVVAVKNGKQVLAIYREVKPDIVILDGIMPEMDGYTACACLKETRVARKTPVLLITAHDSQDAVDKAFAAGADEYLTKPIYWNVLKYRLQRILATREAEIQLQRQNEYLTALTKVSFGLLHRLDVDEVLAMIVKHAVELFDHASGGLYLQNGDQAELKFAIGLNRQYVGFTQSKEVGLVGEVFATGRACVIDNYQDWNKRIEDPIFDAFFGIIGLPLIHAGKTVGVISIFFNDPERVFTVEEQNLLEQFIGLAAIAYDNAVLYKKAQEEIAERKIVEEKLRYMSLYDSLTGLYNRTYFEEEMNRITSGRHISVGIVVCDINQLKQVNDTFGHDKGDALIMAAAQVLQDSFRGSDVIARIGGDEFVVLLPGTSQTRVKEACDKLREKINCYPVFLEGFKLSMAIGWAVSYGQQVDIRELFRQADQNMYIDKKEYRNT